MVGEIVHVGSEVKGFSRGARITLATTVSCGECAYCALGLGNICPNAKPIGFDHDGAMAEYLAIPPSTMRGGNVIVVPDNVPDQAAALSEPLSCAVNAQTLCGVKPGDKVLILGGGPLGALHSQLARAWGAEDVMVSEPAESRLCFLRKLEGVFALNAEPEEVSAIVKSRTAGLGADVVIVCAPTREAHEAAIDFARKGGAVSFFASLPPGASTISLDSRVIHYGELRLFGASDHRPEHVRYAVELLAQGRIDVRGLITHRLPLEGFHAGVALMKERKSLKVLLYPGGAPTI
jgi:L-iditol 2-dehydrogenase